MGTICRMVALATLLTGLLTGTTAYTQHEQLPSPEDFEILSYSWEYGNANSRGERDLAWYVGEVRNNSEFPGVPMIEATGWNAQGEVVAMDDWITSYANLQSGMTAPFRARLRGIDIVEVSLRVMKVYRY
jgi:hypothetical protein